MVKEFIVGDLEIRVGTARKKLVERTRSVENAAFRGKTEKEWLSENDPVNVQNNTHYTLWMDATEELELWEFLLTAARNWEPGDTAVELLETGTDDPGPGWNVHKSPYTDTGTSGQ